MPGRVAERRAAVSSDRAGTVAGTVCSAIASGSRGATPSVHHVDAALSRQEGRPGGGGGFLVCRGAPRCCATRQMHPDRRRGAGRGAACQGAGVRARVVRGYPVVDGGDRVPTPPPRFRRPPTNGSLEKAFYRAGIRPTVLASSCSGRRGARRRPPPSGPPACSTPAPKN